MALNIEIQHATPYIIPVSDEVLLFWARHVLKNQQITHAELTLRIVNTSEMSEINAQFRKKTGPTNVLSFPNEIPKKFLAQINYPFLGDIIICPDVLEKEAKEQEKTIHAHWAHIVIHGVLHLLGYDHIQEDEEKIMQSLEIDLLKKINFDNPYE